MPANLFTWSFPVGFLACTFAVAAAGLGCGPIGSTSLIGDAEIAVARAHAADGDTRAIYETTSADLYLQKAKEEQGHARYGPAMELAKRSVELAEAATLKASRQRAGATPTAPGATFAHPADGAPLQPGRPQIEGPAAAPPSAPSPAPSAPSPAPPASAAAPPKTEAPPAQRPVLMPGAPPPSAPRPPERKEKQPISPEGGL